MIDLPLQMFVPQLAPFGSAHSAVLIWLQLVGMFELGLLVWHVLVSITCLAGVDVGSVIWQYWSSIVYLACFWWLIGLA